MKKELVTLIGLILITFSGCSNKEEALSEKSANFWYQKIIRSIGMMNLNKADDYYTSLHSEHPSSPLLPQAILMLSKAHAEFDELILSQYYLDEYLKRFGDSKEREYAEFLKVKLAFLNYRHPNRNQKFLDETIATLESFQSAHAESPYLPMVNDMLLRLSLGRDAMREEIAGLYTRLEKPKAAEHYRNQREIDDINSSEVHKPNVFWLRALVE